jgi:hypothetical protein
MGIVQLRNALVDVLPEFSPLGSPDRGVGTLAEDVEQLITG